MLFNSRQQAGQELVKQLEKYSLESPIILALPRGGVVIGYEIARALNTPLEVIVTRKLGLPNNKELGVGAIGENETKFLDQQILSNLGLTENDLDDISKEERVEMNRRIKLYRKNQPLPNLKDRTVILIDDGLATGVTAKVAITAIKKMGPKKIIFAAPVCAYETAKELSFLVDDVVCFALPFNLISIGSWYQNFEQVSDQQVLELLNKAKEFSRQNQKEGEKVHYSQRQI